MCRWCRHAFTKEEADVAPFRNGKVIHCPFCDLPLDANNLPPPTNLAGQLSKGTKSSDTTFPSLAVDIDQKVDPEEYNARRLAEQIIKHNSNLLRKGGAENVGDATTIRGGSTTNTNLTLDDIDDVEVIR